MRQVVENACGSYQSFTFVPGRTLVLTKKNPNQNIWVFCLFFVPHGITVCLQ